MNKGKTGPVFGWVIPAGQHARQNAAEAVNDLRAQGLEFHRATAAFTVAFAGGRFAVKPGDYIVRGDQPYRTLADMYFALQNYPADNPSPYDDTGWTFPLMRDLTVEEVTDSSLLRQPMTPITAPVTAAGGISGHGPVVIVENDHDNALVTFRFRFKDVAMLAAEAPFDAAGHHFGAGTLIVPQADAAVLGPALAGSGLTGYAVDAVPSVATHALDVPRIAFVHSWSSTQDEGWVRGALDHYGVPYSYFGEPVLKQGHLRDKYDVIIYPSGGSGGRAGGRGGRGGGAATGTAQPVPYRKTAEFPSFGTPDSTDNLYETAGPEAMQALYQFVEDGGTLIVEGGTTPVFPDFGLTPGVTVEHPSDLFAWGSILRGVITDSTSPLVYGYVHDQVPVYFNGGPVLNAGNPPLAEDSAAGAGRGGRGSRVSQNTVPNATLLDLSPWDPDHTGLPLDATQLATDSAFNASGRGGRGRGGFGGGRGAGRGAAAPGAGLEGVTAPAGAHARVVMRFPSAASEMLLSGALDGGEALANRAQLVDESVGKGHIVMFAFRPYWRWQTQGTFAMGFNAIVNWNHLDAGGGH